MPVLKNSKHELFAQARFAGATADAAYEAAGFNPHRGNASRLSAKENVLRRIAELQGAVAKKAVVDKAWVLGRLVENVDTCLMHNEVKGIDGKPTGIITHNPAAANKALELIGKDLGMWPNRLEHTGKDGAAIQVEEELTIEKRSANDLARRIAFMLSKGAKTAKALT